MPGVQLLGSVAAMLGSVSGGSKWLGGGVDGGAVPGPWTILITHTMSFYIMEMSR
jgi:hypothetical protein